MTNPIDQDLAMTVRMADDAWIEGARREFRSHMETARAFVEAGAVLEDEELRDVFAYLTDRYNG